MASTNKTTNYGLSQYIGTDKPTYLTDYNQDMTKIDTGIHAAKLEADNNATSIGTLSNLSTTAKADLVSAINEVDGDVATNTNNIATNTSNIATNTTHIGTITNLTTTSKTDLVVAANEINAKVGNLSSLESVNKTNLVSAINEVFNYLNLNEYISVTNISTSVGSIISSNVNIAKNSDGSLGKIYGTIFLNLENTSANPVITFSSPFRPTNKITIQTGGETFVTAGSAFDDYPCDISIDTDGTVSLTGFNAGYVSRNRINLYPVLLFIKDFGDIPSNN